MSIKNIFNNSFYCHFQAPNAEKLIRTIENEKTKIDNSQFDWGDKCDVDRIPVLSQDYAEVLIPSIQFFSMEMGRGFEFELLDPWINVYEKGGYQELHDHRDDHFVLVFFVNDGPDFAEFYFADRHGMDLCTPLRQYFNIEEWTAPKIKAGDIIFFPGHMLHGVSKHRSSVKRKTLSANFNIILPDS